MKRNASPAVRPSPPGCPTLFILTGAVHSGKTTFLKSVAAEANLRSLRVDGYLSPAVWEQGTSQGYDLLTLPEERLFPFLRTKGQPEFQHIGPYWLIPQTLDTAQAIIRAAMEKSLLIVDEVGPLELSGQGVWPALEEALRHPPRKMVLTIREPLLAAFLLLIPAGQPDIFRVDDRAAVARILG